MLLRIQNNNIISTPRIINNNNNSSTATASEDQRTQQVSQDVNDDSNSIFAISIKNDAYNLQISKLGMKLYLTQGVTRLLGRIT
jgi:hypothetical protein